MPMRRRVFSVLALLAGVSVSVAAAAAVTRFQLLCQEGEQPEEKKASKKQEKATKSKSMGKGTRNIKPCNLTGWWKNDLGSRMQVFEVGKDGTFSGEYHTAASITKKPIQPSPLIGSQHLDEDGQCTFGFTVNWKKFSDSTAVFVGQCFNEGDGKEVLHTSWLLREKVDSEPDDWRATRTGHNTFTRTDCEEGEASRSSCT